MFRLGATLRGRSPFVLPAVKPLVSWAFQAAGPIVSSPAIASDGSVLVGSQDGKVYAVGRDGTLRWSYATGDIIFSSPALAHDGTIYIGSDDDHLYALNPATGKPKWSVQMGACPQRVGIGPEASRCDVDAGPTVGPDGVIYTGGDGIYAINPDGTLRWHYVTGGHVSSAPAVLPDGTVVAGCQDDLLYAIAPNGQKKWDFRAGADIEASPAISESRTSAPPVIMSNAFSTAVCVPPFLNRPPFPDAITTGATALRAWTAGAPVHVSNALAFSSGSEIDAPAAAVATRKSRRLIPFVSVIGRSEVDAWQLASTTYPKVVA